jgi:cysteine-rich repeat protein
MQKMKQIKNILILISLVAIFASAVLAFGGGGGDGGGGFGGGGGDFGGGGGDFGYPTYECNPSDTQTQSCGICGTQIQACGCGYVPDPIYGGSVYTCSWTGFGTCNDPCYVPAPICGNSVIETGEQCDDGNLYNGDGCNSICEVELPPAPICGNNIIESGEQCDLGSDNGNICIPGYGLNCSYCSISCEDVNIIGGICGDNNLDTGFEQCDDGNNINGDGCSNLCLIELPPAPVCGNNIIESGEQCDLGSSNGVICDPGYEGSCSYCSISCEDVNIIGGICGDNNLDTGFEQCDDGNLYDGDGCSSICEIELPPAPVCGNSVIETGEQCDFGSDNGVSCIPGYEGSCSYCSISCEDVNIIGGICGDNNLDTSFEQCDDGNLYNGDGCSSICEIEPIIIEEYEVIFFVYDSETNNPLIGAEVSFSNQSGFTNFFGEILFISKEGNFNWDISLSGYETEIGAVAVSGITIVEVALEPIKDEPKKKKRSSSGSSCINNWDCSEWGLCNEGVKTRICTNYNSCDNYVNKPTEEISCEIQEMRNSAIYLQGSEDKEYKEKIDFDEDFNLFKLLKLFLLTWIFLIIIAIIVLLLRR